MLRLGLRRPLPCSRPHRTSSLPLAFSSAPPSHCRWICPRLGTWSPDSAFRLSAVSPVPTPLSPPGTGPEFCHSPCVKTPGSRWDSLPSLADPSRCLLVRQESEGGRSPAAAGRRRLGQRCSCWTGSTACWPRWGCARRWPRSSSSASITPTRPSSSTCSRTRSGKKIPFWYSDLMPTPICFE